MNAFPEPILRRLRNSRVVAGFMIHDIANATPVCRALLDGGIDCIELMLRSSSGLEAVRTICEEVPQMLVGVGTILEPEQVMQVQRAGASFGVSPGLNPRVLDAAREASFPFAPGICTPSDLELAIERGCRFVKFFPSEPMGGVNYLRAISAPYAHLDIQYFPLGGINEENVVDYLQEPNVAAVGGSWLVDSAMVSRGDWASITAKAAATVNLLKTFEQAQS